MIIDWINSTAARLGFGPPEWIVSTILLALVLVAAFETGGGRTGGVAAVLTRKEKHILVSLGGLIAFSIGAFAIRMLLG